MSRAQPETLRAVLAAALAGMSPLRAMRTICPATPPWWGSSRTVQYSAWSSIARSWAKSCSLATTLGAPPASGSFQISSLLSSAQYSQVSSATRPCALPPPLAAPGTTVVTWPPASGTRRTAPSHQSVK